MKNKSLTKSLPALITLTGGALAAGTVSSDAAVVSQKPDHTPGPIESRISDVQQKLAENQPGLSFAEKTQQTEKGMQTFWWGNWHNGGPGPGAWHNWGNGGWHNWGNGGWGNGGWHNFHNF